LQKSRIFEFSPLLFNFPLSMQIQIYETLCQKSIFGIDRNQTFCIKQLTLNFIFFNQ